MASDANPRLKMQTKFFGHCGEGSAVVCVWFIVSFMKIARNFL